MKRRDFLTYSLLTGGSSLLLPLVTACQKGIRFPLPCRLKEERK